MPEAPSRSLTDNPSWPRIAEAVLLDTPSLDLPQSTLHPCQLGGPWGHGRERTALGALTVGIVPVPSCPLRYRVRGSSQASKEEGTLLSTETALPERHVLEIGINGTHLGLSTMTGPRSHSLFLSQFAKYIRHEREFHGTGARAGTMGRRL